ncbi:MAG: TonB-dependent receptor, partial [Bacteroidia bacterium]|nr:TonB-dependent receptor [Bacteroidia bacterium]
FYLPLFRYNHSFTYIGQIAGEHQLFRFKNKRVVKGEWQVNYSVLDYREPYYKGHVYGYDERNEPSRYLYIGQFENDYDYMLSLRMTTHLYGVFASASVPFHKNAYLQLGTFAKFTESFGQAHRLQVAFDYDGEYRRTLLPEITDYTNIRNIFADENIGPGKINLWDVTTDFHNYDGRRQNLAPFAALHWGPGPKWKINTGLRAEYFNQTIFNLPVFGPPNRLVAGDKFDLLPSLNVLFMPTEKINLRAAYFETVVRPTEREMVPFEYLNPVTTLKTIGNPEVTRTRLYNADLRAEYFFSGKEHVSLSLFYKYFTDPLEQQLIRGRQGATSALNTFYMVVNQNSALVAGAETEVRVLADRVLPFHTYLKNFNLYFNFTLLQSRINASPSVADLFKPGRTLQGQANYVLNWGLLYTEPKTGIDFNLFFNRIGNRISMVG